MTKREQASIKRFAAFAVSLCVRSWFVVPLAAAAPANDLAFLKQLAIYNDKVVSSEAIKAFSRHLWYLNELLVSLSFFDSDVSLTVKRDMINALNKDGTDNPAKRINLRVIQCIHEKTVADFVTSSSRLVFQMLDIDTEFLSVDPSEWDRSSDYQSAMNTVKALKVVNDSAERGVALMQDYNSILTNNEDQKQYLLQIVEEHGKKFPNALKMTVSDSTKQTE